MAQSEGLTPAQYAKRLREEREKAKKPEEPEAELENPRDTPGWDRPHL